MKTDLIGMGGRNPPATRPTKCLARPGTLGWVVRTTQIRAASIDVARQGPRHRPQRTIRPCPPPLLPVRTQPGNAAVAIGERADPRQCCRCGPAAARSLTAVNELVATPSALQRRRVLDTTHHVPAIV
jgi:hypothetical protein